MAITHDIEAPWQFEDLTRALRRAHDDLMAGKRVDWQGPDMTWSKILAGAPGVPACFEPEWLVYYSEHDRDLLEVLIMAAVQLGMEQGARVAAQDQRRWGPP